MIAGADGFGFEIEADARSRRWRAARGAAQGAPADCYQTILSVFRATLCPTISYYSRRPQAMAPLAGAYSHLPPAVPGSRYAALCWLCRGVGDDARGYADTFMPTPRLFRDRFHAAAMLRCRLGCAMGWFTFIALLSVTPPIRFREASMRLALSAHAAKRARQRRHAMLTRIRTADDTMYPFR